MTARDKLAARPADPPEADFLGPDVAVTARRPPPPASMVVETVPCPAEAFAAHAQARAHRFVGGCWTCLICHPERPA